MRLTDHAVRFVNICHFLRQQQQLLLGTLGEGKAEGDFELLKGRKDLSSIKILGAFWDFERYGWQGRNERIELLKQKTVLLSTKIGFGS